MINRKYGYKAVNREEEINNKRTWRLIYPDGTESIGNFNPIKFKEEYMIEQFKKIIDESKCYCEVCAFDGKHNDDYDKLIQAEELKEKIKELKEKR